MQTHQPTCVTFSSITSMLDTVFSLICMQALCSHADMHASMHMQHAHAMIRFQLSAGQAKGHTDASHSSKHFSKTCVLDTCSIHVFPWLHLYMMMHDDEWFKHQQFGPQIPRKRLHWFEKTSFLRLFHISSQTSIEDICGVVVQQECSRAHTTHRTASD